MNVGEFINCPKCGKKECLEITDMFLKIDGDTVICYHCHECLYETEEIETW